VGPTLKMLPEAEDEDIRGKKSRALLDNRNRDSLCHFFFFYFFLFNVKLYKSFC
jgi:hypothetical protein